jgi:hypothetical protein
MPFWEQRQSLRLHEADFWEEILTWDFYEQKLTKYVSNSKLIDGNLWAYWRLGEDFYTVSQAYFALHKTLHFVQNF